MTNNTERELAEIAFILRKADSTDTLLWADAERMAAALVEVGFRRPRTITTAEELDALPVDAVIRDDEGYVWERWGADPTYWDCAGVPDWESNLINLPAIVLWEPSV